MLMHKHMNKSRAGKPGGCANKHSHASWTTYVMYLIHMKSAHNYKIFQIKALYPKCAAQVFLIDNPSHRYRDAMGS